MPAINTPFLCSTRWKLCLSSALYICMRRAADMCAKHKNEVRTRFNLLWFPICRPAFNHITISLCDPSESGLKINHETARHAYLLLRRSNNNVDQMKKESLTPTQIDGIHTHRHSESKWQCVVAANGSVTLQYLQEHFFIVDAPYHTTELDGKTHTRPLNST